MVETETHIFFYKTAKHYSNFYKTEFYYDGHLFHNSEQAFMYCKANHFKDYDTMEAILEETDPMSVKYLGRLVQGYDEDDWNRHRQTYMFGVCFAKYSQNETIKNDLISTGNKILVEASPTDRIWGIGLPCSSPDIYDEKKWRGQNLLGKVLMYVRDELIKIDDLNSCLK